MHLPPPTIALSQLLQPEQILELAPMSKPAALAALCRAAARNPFVHDERALLEAIVRREEQMSTGVGLGFAIPHAKIPALTNYVLAVGRVRAGMDFAALDGQPVHLIFLIGASDHQTREFVRILAKVTHLLKDEPLRRRLLEATIPDEFIRIVRDHEGL